MTAIRVFLSLLFSALLFGTTTQAQNISSADRRAARKVSDSFMADLVANRSSDAMQKMNVPRDVAMTQYTQLIDTCGRPLDSKIANDGVHVAGEDVLSDGRTRNTLIFQYVCKSTRHSGWVFKVEVEMAEDAKYHVFGVGLRETRSFRAGQMSSAATHNEQEPCTTISSVPLKDDVTAKSQKLEA
jgi:hypothetical protein